MDNLSYHRDLIIDNRELKYNGLFRADELFSAINKAIVDRGYTKREKKTEETVTEAGRRTYIELRPLKHKSVYAYLMIKIRVTLDGVTETVEEVKREKRRFQNGIVHLGFDAWLMTNYNNRWGMKPTVYFIKSFINKFIWPLPYEGSFPGEIASDTAYIYAQVKKLLNSYKEENHNIISEEEIRKKMEEEIRKNVTEELHPEEKTD
jgi:hypothetical protein